MGIWHTVANRNELKAGQVRVVQVGSERLALCNADGTFFAVDDTCTHDGGPLAQGDLDGTEIECPRHGARFDVRTGRVTALPAFTPIETYPVRVIADDVQVELD